MSKVLIVEDEIIIAEDLKQNLEDNGILVCGCATDKEEAVQIIREKSPDIILLDIYLNDEIDGFEVAKQARQFNKNIRIIFITGYSQRTHSDKLKKIQNYTFLEKPVNIKQVVNTVKMMEAEE